MACCFLTETQIKAQLQGHILSEERVGSRYAVIGGARGCLGD